ncbi:MAG: archaemetzincin family Zn-dependent metalloprotease [Candidatus Kryptoniota bacterium]
MVRMSSIILVAIAPVDTLSIALLANPLGEAFSRPVEIIKPPPLDGAFAFNFSRNQYSSTLLLSALLEKFSEWVSSNDKFDGKILGVTEGDLFVPVLTYVFGEAQLDGKVAVVSSHRLREEFYGLQPDADVFKARLLKEAIHELGHTFGLLHCNNYLCVMHSSTGVEEIDVKTERLCEDCRRSLLSANPSY